MPVDTQSEPSPTEKEDEHHHDAPIDDAKLDSLLWELVKFCVPIGFVLWLSIYLMYRNQFSDWSTRAPGGGGGGGVSAQGRAGGDKLGGWIKQEEKVAWREMVSNVGPASGAADGAVVASPSAGEWEDEPDYYYTWTRDSALTMLTVSSRFLPRRYLKPWTYNHTASVDNVEADDSIAESDPLIEPLIRDYIAFQSRLQTVTSRSGDLWTGGLNEPKFHVDGSAFNDDWGRPQRDGPALRTLTLIPYAHYLLDRSYPSDITYVQTHLYDRTQIRKAGSVIKNDLEEVAGGWWASGFDLWEELDGHHLFTLLASLRALEAGSTLAQRLDERGAADFYTAQADMLRKRLEDFRASDGTWRESILSESGSLIGGAESAATSRAPTPGSHMALERTGLDCAVPLASIHYGSSASAEATAGVEFGPGSPDALATLHAYILSFGGLYRINDGKAWTDGWGVGRYAEDVYNGIGTSRGNPWFICTFTVAHSLYAAARILSLEPEIVVTNTSAAFWSDILATHTAPGEKLPLRPPSEHVLGVRVGEGPSRGQKAIERVIEVGDAYMQVGQKYAGEEGKMSEQFHRSDGALIGARDLTWSYASFLEAAWARKEARMAVFGHW